MADDDEQDRAARRRRRRAEAKSTHRQEIDLDPRVAEGCAMLARTGAREVQIRYDENTPPAWLCVAHYLIGADGRPTSSARGDPYWDVAAGRNPLSAVMRLCETMIDGSTCNHCKRPAGFDKDFGALPLTELFCWYQWDPELETFRQGCEGE